MSARYVDPEERFWSKADKSGECWLWTSAIGDDGYGLFGVYRAEHRRMFGATRTMRAHRLAWMLTNGPIPAGMLICHRCDVPLCVNPAHLFLGTPSDNMRDMHGKGRNWQRLKPQRIVRGDRKPNARLSSESVRVLREMRARGDSYATIARTLGVGRTTVEQVVRGLTWRHVA